MSESTARNLWPGENPLGKNMRLEGRLRDGSIGAIMPVAKVIVVPISMAVPQAIRSMLFGLSTRDPATYGGVALLLATARLMACWRAARRAAKVDPVVALRAE